MLPNIEVEHVYKGLDLDLAKQVWTFFLIDSELVLNSYQTMERPSKRHKWTVNAIYDRLDRRQSTMTLAEVELPDFVCVEAKQKLMAMITVVKERTR